MPVRLMVSSRPAVKCRPTFGVTTDPGVWAYSVWYYCAQATQVDRQTYEVWLRFVRKDHLIIDQQHHCLIIGINCEFGGYVCV
jgi:hypothetical protein